MDSILLNVKVRPDKKCQEMAYKSMPIIAPHLLVRWLLDMGLLKFDRDAANQFWAHHRAQGVAWMEAPDFDTSMQTWWFEPFALYGDEAEYTLSKEKIFILFASPLFGQCL